MISHSETWHRLHRLWTKAVGTPDYDKREWLALEKDILALESFRNAETIEAKEKSVSNKNTGGS